MSGRTDDDLLTRLNALRKSTVVPERKVDSSTDNNGPDDETADMNRRLLKLRAGPDGNPPEGEYVDEHGNYIGMPSNPIFDEESEPMGLDDPKQLLKELKSQKDAGLASGDDQRVKILLAMAQQALDDDEEDSEPRSVTRKAAGLPESQDQEPDAEGRQDSKRSSVNDDDEAADLLAQILAEVQLDAENAPAEVHEASDGEDNSEHGGSSTFDENLFPTTPSKEPELPAPPSDDPLQLPSAPTSAPVKPKPKSTASKKFTDVEIETWCEICQADAEVRCLGCEGELYCLRCWKEGHTGPDAGYEERRHRCVQYSKPGPEAAAA